MKDKSLLVYIFGLFSGYILINMFESLYSLFDAWIQVLCIKPTKIINEYQKSMCVEEEEVQERTPAIGFAIPNDDEYYDEE